MILFFSRFRGFGVLGLNGGINVLQHVRCVHLGELPVVWRDDENAAGHKYFPQQGAKYAVADDPRAAGRADGAGTAAPGRAYVHDGVRGQMRRLGADGVLRLAQLLRQGLALLLHERPNGSPAPCGRACQWADSVMFLAERRAPTEVKEINALGREAPLHKVTGHGMGGGHGFGQACLTKVCPP